MRPKECAERSMPSLFPTLGRPRDTYLRALALSRGAQPRQFPCGASFLSSSLTSALSSSSSLSVVFVRGQYLQHLAVGRGVELRFLRGRCASVLPLSPPLLHRDRTPWVGSASVCFRGILRGMPVACLRVRIDSAQAESTLNRDPPSIYNQ